MRRSDALLVVDVQRGFVNAHTNHIPMLVEHLQLEYRKVVVTRFHNAPDSPFRRIMDWHQCARESADFPLAFRPRPDAIIVDKTGYSCVNPEFLYHPDLNGIRSMDVVGIDTDACVTQCAVDLFEAGIEPFVLGWCCASSGGPEAHRRGLETLPRLIGERQVVVRRERL